MIRIGRPRDHMLKRITPNYRINVPYAVATAVALLIGLASAISLRWICDNAFITFRYIENFLTGNGLVYNVGERAEGYTHFLWLMIVASFQWLGADPVPTSEYLGLIAFAGVIVLAIVISYQTGKATFLPLAALALAAHYDFTIWATGGLETMMFTFLILLSGYLLFVRRTFFWGGFVLMLSVMTRPDGVVMCAVALICIIRDGRQAVMKFALPFLLLIPWLVWKYWYYGDVLPNTYYAKSAGLSYFSQGWEYLWTYFWPYKTSFIFLLALFAIRNRLVQFCLGVIVVYGILFVAKTGGDFMYARFMVPLIPLIYITGEVSVRQLLKNSRWTWAVCVAIPLLVWAEKSSRNDLFLNRDGTHKESFLDLGGITDEQWYYTQPLPGDPNRIQQDKFIGESLRKYFEGEHIRILSRGQDALAYYGKFSECIENAGLTDATIAHLPVETRGRPGHEKHAPRSYLINRKVHFLFLRPNAEIQNKGVVGIRTAKGWIGAEIITYDAGLMARLTARWPQDIRYRIQGDTAEVPLKKTSSQ